MGIMLELIGDAPRTRPCSSTSTHEPFGNLTRPTAARSTIRISSVDGQRRTTNADATHGSEPMLRSIRDVLKKAIAGWPATPATSNI